MQHLLNPEEFIQQFAPTEYGDDWDEVEDDPAFLSGEGWKVDDLTESIAERGVQEPVSVYKNALLAGHHRVVAARWANKPIPYKVYDDPFDVDPR